MSVELAQCEVHYDNKIALIFCYWVYIDKGSCQSIKCILCLLTAVYSECVHASPIRDEREARESASGLDNTCPLPIGYNLGFGGRRAVSEELTMLPVHHALAALQVDMHDVNVMLARLGEVRPTYYDMID